MRLPRDLSGRELAAALERTFGYKRVHQAGSHIILQVEVPRHHRLAVPDHRPLRIGTLNAILRAVSDSQGLSKDDVLRRLSN